MTRGIAKDAEYVFSVDFSRFIAQVVEVDEEVKHEVFVNDVVPIFRFNIRKYGRAESPVERDDFVELLKARPRDVFSPTRI